MWSFLVFLSFKYQTLLSCPFSRGAMWIVCIIRLPKLTTFNFGHHFVCENRVRSWGEIARSHNTGKKWCLGQSTKVFSAFSHFSKNKLNLLIRKNILIQKFYVGINYDGKYCNIIPYIYCNILPYIYCNILPSQMPLFTVKHRHFAKVFTSQINVDIFKILYYDWISYIVATSNFPSCTSGPLTKYLSAGWSLLTYFPDSSSPKGLEASEIVSWLLGQERLVV